MKKYMKEYYSLPLEDEEAQALLDISLLTNEPVRAIPFLGNIDDAKKDFDFRSNEAFWYENNHIIGLLFASSKLTELPESIGNLPFLRFLVIIHGLIQFLPSTIKKLKKLERLEFHHSEEDNPGISIEFPDIFQYLFNLREFTIYGHYPIYIPPSFLELKNLEILKLEYCTVFLDHFEFLCFGKKHRISYSLKPIMELPLDFEKLNSLKKKLINHITVLNKPNSVKKFKSKVRKITIKHPMLINLRNNLRDIISQAVEFEKQKLLAKRRNEKDYDKRNMIWDQYIYLGDIFKKSICKCQGFNNEIHNWCKTTDSDMVYLPALDSEVRGWYCTNCFPKYSKYKDFHYFEHNDLMYHSMYIQGNKTFLKITGGEGWHHVGEIYELAPSELQLSINENIDIQLRDNTVYIFVYKKAIYKRSDTLILYNFPESDFQDLGNRLKSWVKSNYKSSNLNPELTKLIYNALFEKKT